MVASSLSVVNLKAGGSCGHSRLSNNFTSDEGGRTDGGVELEWKNARGSKILPHNKNNKNNCGMIK